ncbi:helix-turn-helix domain-containing protein [Aeromicrobium sp. Sec7.5]|uniref:helix-turn-helix domain-containing protein n=1 Tax=Aeromicrobium sp. Sec7.5 TaxID=3121276 RepID=UPI003FA5F2E3
MAGRGAPAGGSRGRPAPTRPVLRPAGCAADLRQPGHGTAAGRQAPGPARPPHAAPSPRARLDPAGLARAGGGRQRARARDRGAPPQTVHHRLKQCRDIFGTVLDEPTQRLELIVALRASQPEWAGRPQA